MGLLRGEALTEAIHEATGVLPEPFTIQDVSSHIDPEGTFNVIDRLRVRRELGNMASWGKLNDPIPGPFSRPSDQKYVSPT